MLRLARTYRAIQEGMHAFTTNERKIKHKSLRYVFYQRKAKNDGTNASFIWLFLTGEDAIAEVGRPKHGREPCLTQQRNACSNTASTYLSCLFTIQEQSHLGKCV